MCRVKGETPCSLQPTDFLYQKQLFGIRAFQQRPLSGVNLGESVASHILVKPGSPWSRALWGAAGTRSAHGPACPRSQVVNPLEWFCFYPTSPSLKNFKNLLSLLTPRSLLSFVPPCLPVFLPLVFAHKLFLLVIRRHE